MITLEYLFDHKNDIFWEQCDIKYSKVISKMVNITQKSQAFYKINYRYNLFSDRLGIHFYMPRPVKLVEYHHVETGEPIDNAGGYYSLWFEGVGCPLDCLAHTNRFEHFSDKEIKRMFTTSEECLQECHEVNMSRTYRGYQYHNIREHFDNLRRSHQIIIQIFKRFPEIGMI